MKAKENFRISVQVGELSGLLKTLNTIIPSKSVLPVIQNVLMEWREGDGFVLTASSSEHWLELTPGKSRAIAARDMLFLAEGKPQAVTLPVGILLEVLGKIPDVTYLDIEFETAPHSMHVVYQTGEFDLPYEVADDFPRCPQTTTREMVQSEEKPVGAATPTVRLHVEGEWLLRNLKAARNFCANDELRPQMGAVAIDATQEDLVVVASDGHQLFKNRRHYGMCSGFCDYLLEAAADGSLQMAESQLMLIHKSVVAPILATFLYTDQLTIVADAQRTEISAEGKRIVIRSVEGKYPNYNSVIPSQQPHTVVLDASQLLAALCRVSIFADDASQLVRMTADLGTQQLTLQAEDVSFARTAAERVQMLDGSSVPDRFAIGIKGTVLQSVLKCVETDNVLLHLTDATRPMTLTEESQDSSLLLLAMPMLLNETN